MYTSISTVVHITDFPCFGSGSGLDPDSIRSVYPWIRTKMLNPDPYQINTNPKHCLVYQYFKESVEETAVKCIPSSAILFLSMPSSQYFMLRVAGTVPTVKHTWWYRYPLFSSNTGYTWEKNDNDYYLGVDRRAGWAGTLHDPTAERAELLPPAVPCPLPEEEPALPPALPRHRRAHHRGSARPLAQPGGQAAAAAPRRCRVSRAGARGGQSACGGRTPAPAHGDCSATARASPAPSHPSR
jgi:hypothetical protein